MLNRQEIRRLIREKGLIGDFCDLEAQLTPNGFDLTAGRVYEFKGPGRLDFSNKERELPEAGEIAARKTSPADKSGWWELPPGVYKIIANETVKLPLDLIGMAFTRSSLLRMGAFVQTGVWDAGFSGKSEFILVVNNPAGIKIKQNARVTQLIFTRITETESGYNGIYQNKA